MEFLDIKKYGQHYEVESILLDYPKVYIIIYIKAEYSYVKKIIIYPKTL